MRKIKQKVQTFRDRQNRKNHKKKAERNAIRKARVAAMRRPMRYVTQPVTEVAEETVTL